MPKIRIGSAKRWKFYTLTVCTVQAAGTGYTIGDFVSLEVPERFGFPILQVMTTGGGGAVTSIRIAAPGATAKDYTGVKATAPISGTGSNLTVNCTFAAREK